MKKKNIMMIIIVGFVLILLVCGILLFLKDNKQQEKFNCFESSMCISKECKFNNNTLKIKENGDNRTILLNNKQVFEAFKNFPISKNIYTFGDTLILSVDSKSYNNYKVLDFLSPKDNDYSEKIVNELEVGMLISDFKVDNEKITFMGSRFIEKDTLLLESIIKIDSCEKYTENQNRVVSGKYVMTYLGNNKFSDIETLEEVKLKNYMDYSKLCEKN